MSLKRSLLLPKFIQRNIRNIMHRTDLKFIDLNQEDGTRSMRRQMYFYYLDKIRRYFE